MEYTQALAEIKDLISNGATEQALAQLLKVVEPNPEMAELAQTIRINQADFFQLKSQALRGTISGDNERLGNNQIRDKILSIVQLIESGKATIKPDQPQQKQVWRYYVSGGIVALALALLGWNFLGKKAGCPEYGKGKSQRVMILPFKKTDTNNAVRPEFDLSDRLNDLIAKDNQINFVAEADVNEAYNIDQNYPNPSEAAKIGVGCEVELVVWGKTSASRDTFEVRYKWVNPNTHKDSMGLPDYLNNLSEITGDGVWRSDVKTIAKFLYLVLATKNRPTEMAFNLLGTMSSNAKSAAIASKMDFVPDTNALFLKADAFTRTPQKRDSAVLVYDEILTYYPDNYRALVGRGVFYMKEQNYAAAAQDLHKAQPDPAKADPAMLRLRTEAYLKVGWPEMARQDLEQIKRDSSEKTNAQWIKVREKSIKDSIQVYEKLLDKSSATLAKQPEDVNAKLKTAKAYNALGKPEEAVKYSEYVKLRKPKSQEAIQASLVSYAQQGETEKAVRTVELAERKGVSTKDIQFKPRIPMLKIAKERPGLDKEQ